MKSHCLTLSILLATTVLSSPAYGWCMAIICPVDDIAVSYWSGGQEATHRQEFVHISPALAAALGIDAEDVHSEDDGEAPNPQIRVRIQSVPAEDSDISSNNAVFTVTEIVETGDASKRIWVHQQQSPGDEESGQFKLFARTDQTVIDTPDSEPNGILDNILVRAYTIPVSSSVVTTNGAYFPITTYFAEPASGMSYTEKAYRRLDDDRVAVLAPHGGNIEKGTSTQANRFAGSLQTLNGTKVNIWNLEGKWGHDQTDERWHITSTSIDIASYPALNAFRPADGLFDYAVSFHGYGGPDELMDCGADPDSYLYEIILGGGAERNLKCAIAWSIRWATEDTVAINLRDDAGHISLADACGRQVTTGGRDGLHEDNIVNRLASNGGIQVEQSKLIREDSTLLTLIPDAVAYGFALHAAFGGTTDYCSLF